MYEERKLEEFLFAGAVYGDCDYDDSCYSWFRLHRLPLPERLWNRGFTQLLIEIGELYPEVPPSRFHLEHGLKDRLGRTPEHYFPGAHFSDKGWAWFCIHLEKGWHAASNIEDGDNLVTVIERIQVGLAWELT